MNMTNNRIKLTLCALLYSIHIHLVSASYSEHFLFSYGKGMTCDNHPLYHRGFKSEIIRSWTFAENRRSHMHFPASFYIPRYSNHTWAPLSDTRSTVYAGLDFFAPYTHGSAKESYAMMSFQRRAKVYLMVPASARPFPPARLPGWRSEGWAILVRGDRRQRTVLGISRKITRGVPYRAYMFSKTGVDVTLPNRNWVRANLQGFKVNGWYNVLVAEGDGSSVSEPSPPPGIHIVAGGRCPHALHEAWTVNGPDEYDNNTRSVQWRTYHPLWDPCYWCAYDHEHGSDPKSLMGYEPRYHYTAWKNYRQDESHGGFKGIVLRKGDYFLYYGIHAHLSGSRRFFARHHTLVIAVTHAYTKKLMLEISFKADLGFAATRLRTKGVCPLKKVDKELFKLRKRGAMRLVNVVDPLNLDRRFVYRKHVLNGKNEHWFTKPMCSTSRHRGPQVDFTNPSTALRTQNSRSGDIVKLGRKHHGVFAQNPSNGRTFTARAFRLGQEICLFRLSDIDGVPHDGKFYTDPYGKKILPGVGPYAIAQYIEPGFSIEIDGKYQASDSWLGLYEKGYRGNMKNIGWAIDPSEN